MRVFTFFLIIGVSTAALIFPINKKSSINKNVPMDWFADLIEQHLKMKTGEFVKQIDTTMKGLDFLVHDAVIDLEKVLESVDESVKDKIAEIILKALVQALNILKPIQDELDKVVPLISSHTVQAGSRDFVSDIIYAILGYTLQEFLTNITEVLRKTEELVQLTYEQLLEVSKELDGPAAEAINDIIQNSIIAAQHLMEPLLRMLGLIIPNVDDIKRPFLKNETQMNKNGRNGAEEVGQVLGIEPMALVEKAVFAYLGFNGIMSETIKDLDEIFKNGDFDGTNILDEIFEEADAATMESLDPIAETLSPVLGLIKEESKKEKHPRKTDEEIIEEHLGISLKDLLRIFESSSNTLDILIYKLSVDLKYIATNVEGEFKIDADERIELGLVDGFSITTPFREVIEAILEKNQLK